MKDTTLLHVGFLAGFACCGTPTYAGKELLRRLLITSAAYFNKVFMSQMDVSYGIL